MQPSTDWKETIAADEDTRFARHAEALRDIQRKVAHGGPPSRALHAKANAGLEAELEVLADLPDHAKAGLFANPAKYQAFVRFSNGAAKRQGDKRGDVRGIAVKVVGVDGKKLIPGMESERTQDFLAIRSPATPFSTVDDFIALVVAAQNPLLLLPRLGSAIGWGRALSLLPKMARALSQPMTTLASTRYFSALPIRCGAYAVHYAFTPRDPV
ncbi:MAG: catalase, partial [Polyangiales bacterium]